MDSQISDEVIRRITNVIGNPVLASALYNSIELALKSSFVQLGREMSVWGVFEHSLNSAIWDIEKDERGKLFKRLLRYGPHDPDDPIAETSDGQTILSDPECGACVEFIFSHMINRFQGELAELLALEPCIILIQEFIRDGKIPADITYYIGNVIREPQYRRGTGKEWGDYAKGADGLVVSEINGKDGKNVLVIHAVIEVKSMQRSNNRIFQQIDHHLNRLNGGLWLGNGVENNYESSRLLVDRKTTFKIAIKPSTWKLSRDVKTQKGGDGSTILVFPEPTPLPVESSIEKLDSNKWSIKLAWSDDALRQAAFEMTYGYMSEVGEHIYTKDNLPKGWEGMSPAEAGYNAIKMMLYYMIHRIHYYYSKRERKITQKERKAIHLYNIYAFGYVLGADSKYMLWPSEGEPTGNEGEGYKPVVMNEKIMNKETGELYAWWDGIDND